MSLPRWLMLVGVTALSACTPLTYVEDAVVHEPIPPRELQQVLLIAPASEDSVRRSYENRCDSELDRYVKTLSSHEVWPDIDDLNRENVQAWLADNPETGGVLVVQLAAMEQSIGTLSAGGVATRELQLMSQPGLTWNYQPDPTTTLPEHPTALTQASLYIMPEGELALTVMARTNVDGALTSLFRSHCDAMIDELEERGWLK